VGLKQAQPEAGEDTQDRFRRTLVGLKPASEVHVVASELTGFRRTLVGLKLDALKRAGVDVDQFQTNPRGVEARGKTLA